MICAGEFEIKPLLFSIHSGKRCTRLSKSDIRVQIVHSDHNTPRGNDDEEDVKEPMVSAFADCTCVADMNEGLERM